MKNSVKVYLIVIFFICVAIGVAGFLLHNKNINVKPNDTTNSIDTYYKTYGKDIVKSEKETFDINYSVVYCYVGDSGKIDINNQDNEKINWYSEDSEIATIDKNGNYSCVTAGKTDVVAEKTMDDYAKATIVVVDKNIDTIDNVQKNDYIEFVNNSKTDNSDSDNKEPENNVPENNDGPIRNNGSVIDNNQTNNVSIEKINIIKESVDIYTNEDYTIDVNVYPSNANRNTLKYTSSDTSILTVDKNGKVHTKFNGTAKVYVSAGKKIEDTIEFNVKSRERIHFISHLESNGTDHVTGDAILIESNGHFAMVDTGNTNSKVYKNIINYLNKYNVKKLDLVLFTHMHGDHVGNLQKLLSSGLIIRNIWMKNYDVEAYRVNYLANPDANNIDQGMGGQVAENNENIILNRSLSRFNRIKYLAENSIYSSQVSNIKYISSYDEGTEFDFKYMKFKMTLFNNKRNVNAIKADDYNSVFSLIEVNNHKVLLTGDSFDTRALNKVASKIGKIDILKLPHHGSRHCALLDKKYTGKKTDENGEIVKSTALEYLNPHYFVITSSKKKLENIRKEYNVKDGNMCVDKIKQYDDVYKYYVDENPNALVFDLSTNNIIINKD